MTRRPARQSPAAPRRPSPATSAWQDQPPGDGHDDPETDLDAHIAWLAADAPPLTGAQRDQLALILRRSVAPGANDPDRPDRPGAPPAGPSLSDQA